ncbi:coiled-coil domain-containing protein 127a [Conger conger]|uniref:coiled-coil domain-containing protein 127a n=1 Tax=Conger conger TaxID=82655 RepID=UPI002A5AAA4F|nr:coiled-coil domain-containing protein 127a [Conger conger]XP_061116447.1 coiled-coil domain-containing protein 127a [Conger conger]
MNNFNDPPEWDFRPGRRGDGDSNKWNYALLIPVLGLAAFHRIWTKVSQKEIGEAKAGFDRDLKAVSGDLETTYREAVKETRRVAARAELELEKEQQRAQGYKQALHSQGQQLLEERRWLWEERQALEEEKRQAARYGLAAALLDDALERERGRRVDAAAVLSEFEAGLVERQSAFCNAFLPRRWRQEMERDLLIRAAKEPLAAELNMESDLKDIFRNDRHCDMSGDKRKNGSLMWAYLRFWQLQVTLQTHQRAQACLLGVKPNQK